MWTLRWLWWHTMVLPMKRVIPRPHAQATEERQVQVNSGQKHARSAVAGWRVNTLRYACRSYLRSYRHLPSSISRPLTVMCRLFGSRIPYPEGSSVCGITTSEVHEQTLRSPSKCRKQRKVLKSGGKYTEAHFRKPEVHFPEVRRQ